MIYRVAVMISGLGKHLDITEALFSNWNSLYDNIKFDFYLATWEDEIDYKNYKWITDYVRIKEEECPYDLKTHQEGKHQPHYCYTLKRVNELRNKSEIKYDAVFQTRTDVLILKDVLDSLKEMLVDVPDPYRDFKHNQIIPEFIFSFEGTTSHRHQMWTPDYFFYGHPKSFDKFACIFEDTYIKKISKEKRMHVLQAEYFFNVGLYNRGISNIRPQLLIREPYRFGPDGSHTNAGWPLKHPSPYQIKNLVKEKGPIFILTHNRYIEKYFKETPKQ